MYALYKGDRLYYVGLASNLRARLKTHLKDRHAGRWDRFSLYVTDGDRHLREIEALVLRIAQPKGNRQRGKLPRSTDLRPQILRAAKRRAREELEQLLGPTSTKTRAARAARRSRARARTRKAPAKRRPAAGLVSSAITLRRTYKGREYRARLLANGLVRVGAKSYDSPSAAAGAIVKRPVNGWLFWRFKDTDGQWVPLARLRQ